MMLIVIVIFQTYYYEGDNISDRSTNKILTGNRDYAIGTVAGSRANTNL